MGLDSVEFIMAVEEAFELHIPDEAAATIITPRILIDYLGARLPRAEHGGCLSQRAFHLARESICAELDIPRQEVRPSTPLAVLFPSEQQHRWAAVRDALGAKQWPRIGRRRFFERALSPHVEECGALAHFLVERQPVLIKGEQHGWTRAQIAEVVHRLIRSELGVQQYTADSHFVEDMGVD